MQINVVSFGYKHGLPLDVDLVLDCRFLPNPHWVEELRPQTGLDPAVRDYVLGQPDAEAVPRAARRAARRCCCPAYAREGRTYLSIAVGCTGGRHRSVVIAEAIADLLRRHGYDADRHPPGHRPVSRAARPRSSPSVAATGWPPRCGPCRRGPATLTAVVSVADDGGSSRPAPRRPRAARRPATSAAASPRSPTPPRRARPRPSSTASTPATSTATPPATSLLAALAAELGDLGPAVRRARRAPLGVDATGAAGDRRRRSTSSPSSPTAPRSAGQVAVEAATGIERRPRRARRTPAVARGASTPSRAADLVVIGPGSLYGSVLAAARRARRARRRSPPRRRRRRLRRATSGRAPRDARLRRRRPRRRARRHGVDPDVVLVQPGALPVGDLDGVEVVEAEVARPARPRPRPRPPRRRRSGRSW